MDYRTLGRTGLKVSRLGFGCGAVGGILVQGERREMVRVVARAIELGVNYFDTAAIYGDGTSESNLGWTLEELRAEVVVGTKVQLAPAEMDHIGPAVINSVDRSLRRLRRDCLDLIQLHNFVGFERRPGERWVSVVDVHTAIEAFHRLHKQGKVRFWGINGLGNPDAVRQALADDVYTVQSCINLLNPTASVMAPTGFPFDDYGQLIQTAAQHDVGVIAIRVLAGGALSGSAGRHANAAQVVEPIASAKSYAEDVALAQRFAFLAADGYAGNLVEAAIRFAAFAPGVSTALVGISTMEQLEQAVAAIHAGPLPAQALARLSAVWDGLGS